MAKAKKSKKKVVEKKVETKVEKVESKSESKRELLVKRVHKRSGEIVAFDLNRVISAIHKAMIATGEGSWEEAEMVANKVYAELVRISKKFKNFLPDVEGIQNIVENELILSEYIRTAKSYILYRAEHAKIREKNIQVPEKVKQLAAESKKYFRNPLGELVYYRTYSRWSDEEVRRETWVETVDRYMAFMQENLGDKLKDTEYKEVRETILRHEAVPSMRLIQFSGAAARRNHASAYNCSFTAPRSFQDFAEIMFLSMSGCGVGFSVESENIQALPQIKYQTGKVIEYTVQDSREGWSDSLAFVMEQWFNGNDVKVDYSLLRPSGARLVTTGGKSSGPQPLIDIHNFFRTKILARQGGHLSNLDAHDMICKIGEGVVSGGVRRTALISLFELSNTDIRDAKNGQFWAVEPQRALANNSAIYMTRPDSATFLENWTQLVKAGSGEPGIFNRGSLRTSIPDRRKKISAAWFDRFGTNPCGEIILRPKQFCNLSEVIARHEDTEASLMRKIKVAAILGTYQSTFTNFIYLSKEWK
jgi:ribonucleoside-diphosphate reductase alpha chain